MFTDRLESNYKHVTLYYNHYIILVYADIMVPLLVIKILLSADIIDKTLII